MNPSNPVYVISKGRSKHCLTAKQLDLLGVPYYLVIEEQERKDYEAIGVFGEILILPFRDKGTSTPARNFCWEHSIQNGFDYHWIIDDNIEQFYRLNRNIKNKISNGAIFKAAEDFMARYTNVAMSGFNYESFCKATDKVPPYILNTKLYSCILIKNDTPFRWEGKYNEDLHLCLRVLKSGLCTIQFNAFLAGKVTTQRMKGGNTDEFYRDEGTLKKSQFIEDEHPDIAKVVWKFNRWYHQVDYSGFKDMELIFRDDYVQKNGDNNYGMELVEVPDIKEFYKELLNQRQQEHDAKQPLLI